METQTDVASVSYAFPSADNAVTIEADPDEDCNYWPLTMVCNAARVSGCQHALEPMSLFLSLTVCHRSTALVESARRAVLFYHFSLLMAMLH